MVEVGAIVLAAGRSARYRAAGGREASKLIAPLGGKPLVRRVVEAALGSRARPAVVVTGHAGAEVEAALADLPVVFARNENFAAGLASSLRVGLAALPSGVAGAVVLLADMPGVEAALIDRLIAAFAAEPAALAVVPSRGGRRGNPALLSRALFPALTRLEGDEGARRLLDQADRASIVAVEVEDDGAAFDVDTPADLARARNLPP
jgi:molybdenum cofactor cytidylyltransferase